MKIIKQNLYLLAKNNRSLPDLEEIIDHVCDSIRYSFLNVVYLLNRQLATKILSAILIIFWHVERCCIRTCRLNLAIHFHYSSRLYVSNIKNWSSEDFYMLIDVNLGNLHHSHSIRFFKRIWSMKYRQNIKPYQIVIAHKLTLITKYSTKWRFDVWGYFEMKNTGYDSFVFSTT